MRAFLRAFVSACKLVFLRSTIPFALAALSFSCSIPFVHAGDGILKIDAEAFASEVPETLNVADHISGEAPVPALKDDAITQKESRSADIRTEHSGHGTRRLMAIADVIAPETSPIVSSRDSFSEAERHVLCAMRTAQIERSEVVTRWLAVLLSRRLGRPVPSVEDGLEDDRVCDSPVSVEPVQRQPVVIRLRSDGVVLSGNPVWNACIAGGPISKDLIMRNRDTFEHRRGHVHVRIPYSCRDYHRGDRAVWHHPDFPDLDVMLDERGRLIGGVPAGTIAVRDTVSVAKKEGGVTLFTVPVLRDEQNRVHDMRQRFAP